MSSPFLIPSDKFSIACGWSPVGLNGETTLNLFFVSMIFQLLKNFLLLFNPKYFLSCVVCVIMAKIF